MDEAIRNVTNTLKETGQWENTIIIFSSDNGADFPDSGGSNYPLKGYKGGLYEGGIRMVGFVHSPLLPNSGFVNNELFHISDWYPTLVNLAGGNTKDVEIDGYDIWKSIVYDLFEYTF